MGVKYNREEDDIDQEVCIRDPFAERINDDKVSNLKQSKRTQRYRSRAKSRISGMSVGDVRYSFNQLRAAGERLTSKLVLYNGQTAGEFALSYLIETSNSMRKRRRRKKDEDVDGSVFSEEIIQNLPKSQLPNPNNCREHETLILMEF